MGELYIVATPIGNLKDITLRALEVLKEVDFILAEDTRVSEKLLAEYGIKKKLTSYHQHSKLRKTEEVISRLQEGAKIALVSDSGTPGVSDPGAKLVEEVLKRTAAKVTPIPGPSALLALASISGFGTDKFVFLGFPPSKNKRKKFFEELASYQIPVIIYESKHRIYKTLNDLREHSGGCQIVLGRELTKKFETIYRGSPDKIIQALEKDVSKGEFALIVKNG